MNLEARIINFRKAIREHRSKKIVEYKFLEYMREYDNKEKDVTDKQNHKDLFQEYFKYMRGD